MKPPTTRHSPFATLLALLLCAFALSAAPISTNKTLMVNTNNVLPPNETNFFATNIYHLTNDLINAGFTGSGSLPEYALTNNESQPVTLANVLTVKTNLTISAQFEANTTLNLGTAQLDDWGGGNTFHTPNNVRFDQTLDVGELTATNIIDIGWLQASGAVFAAGMSNASWQVVAGMQTNSNTIALLPPPNSDYIYGKTNYSSKAWSIDSNACFRSGPGAPSSVAFGQFGNFTNGIYFPGSNSVGFVNNGVLAGAFSNGNFYAFNNLTEGGYVTQTNAGGNIYLIQSAADAFNQQFYSFNGFTGWNIVISSNTFGIVDHATTPAFVVSNVNDTIVFAGNVIGPSNVSAATFTGDGSSVSNLNAVNIASGTLPASRLPTTLALSVNSSVSGSNTTWTNIAIVGGAVTITTSSATTTVTGTSVAMTNNGTNIFTVGANQSPAFGATGSITGGTIPAIFYNGAGGTIGQIPYFSAVSRVTSSGLNYQNPNFSGLVTATNGLASFSSNAPAMNATGFTNPITTNIVWFVGFTCASATYSNSATKVATSLGAISSPGITIPLMPGDAIVGGSTCAALFSRGQ